MRNEDTRELTPKELAGFEKDDSRETKPRPIPGFIPLFPMTCVPEADRCDRENTDSKDE